MRCSAVLHILSRELRCCRLSYMLIGAVLFYEVPALLKACLLPGGYICSLADIHDLAVLYKHGTKGLIPTGDRLLGKLETILIAHIEKSCGECICKTRVLRYYRKA